MIRFIIFCFCILTLFSAVLCEIVQKLECGETENKKCQVKNVRITPCKEALKAPVEPCKLKRNKVSELEVDFVPKFVATNLSAHLYWVNDFTDVAFPEMDTVACKTTQCPTAIDVQQTYTYSLKMSKSFPTGLFNSKFILNGDHPDDEMCCFIFRIRIK